MTIGSLLAVPNQAIKDFTDQEIGENYYSLSEIEVIKKKSVRDGKSASLALLDGAQVAGVRISYPHGQWSKGKGLFLSSEKWPWPIAKTAYFQSLFVGQKYQNQGWGKKLSESSLKILQDLGALGVVCHSWVESPHNSSRKYLVSLQFKSISLYPEYWKQVDYTCPRCGKPCLCTAEEMYRDLKENPI